LGSRHNQGNSPLLGTVERSSEPSSTRLLLFFLAAGLSTLLFLKPVVGIVHLSLSQPDASHLLLIPLLAAWLVWIERTSIFQAVFYDLKSALWVYGFALLLGVLIWWKGADISSDWHLTIYAVGLVLSWVACFLLAFGSRAAQIAKFPLAFLLLFVPIPAPILDRLIYYLQWGSTEVTSFLFDLSGIPVLREGFVFHLPRYSIFVAKECSGIRSSLALFVLTLIVAHFSLRTFWRKALFIVIGLLVMIVKNGVRIFALSALANYVNPNFLFGSLHRQGGVVFFILGLLLLLPVLRILVRTEQKTAQPILNQAS
jgi:exosortase